MKKVFAALILFAAACGAVEVPMSQSDEPAAADATPVMGTGAWAKAQMAAGAKVKEDIWGDNVWIAQDPGSSPPVYRRGGTGWLVPGLSGRVYAAAIPDSSTGWVVVP